MLVLFKTSPLFNTTYCSTYPWTLPEVSSIIIDLPESLNRLARPYIGCALNDIPRLNRGRFLLLFFWLYSVLMSLSIAISVD